MTHSELRLVIPPRKKQIFSRNLRTCRVEPLEKPARNLWYGKEKNAFPGSLQVADKKSAPCTAPCPVRPEKSEAQKRISKVFSAPENHLFALFALFGAKFCSKETIKMSSGRSVAPENAVQPSQTAFFFRPLPRKKTQKRLRKTRRFTARRSYLPASRVLQNGRSVHAVRHFPSKGDDSRPKAPSVPLPGGQACSPAWHSGHTPAPPPPPLPGRTTTACAWGHAPSEAIPVVLRFSNRFLIRHRYWADFRSAHKNPATPCLCRDPAKISPEIYCLAPTLYVLRVCS